MSMAFFVQMMGCQQGKVDKKDRLPKIQEKNEIVFNTETRNYIQNILK
jgi:hypothetical protein